MAEIVLEIDGVKGECTTDGFKEMIVCKDLAVAFAQEVERSTNAARTVHTVNVEDITVNRNFDLSSLRLIDHVVTGKVTPKAVLHVLRSGGDGELSQVEFLRYILTNCVIASHSLNAGESDLAETIILNFTKIEVEYQPQQPDGTHKGWDRTNYNVQLGKKE